MLDTKAFIYAALTSNSPLTMALGSTSKIQFMYPNDFNTLPIVTYQETSNITQDFFDNVPFNESSTIEIHVWANVSTTALAKLVDAVMIGLLYSRDFSADVADPNSKIFHKVLRYRRTLTADDIDSL
jgi:hypothetical protein